MKKQWVKIEIPENEKITTYPIVINRFLSLARICSRRAAVDLIKKGKVRVNNKISGVGDRVAETDTVEVTGDIAVLPESYKYYLYNKPVGIVSHNPQEGEQGVEDVFKKEVPLYPVGRLDKASEGLMLLTNDGRLISKVTDPEYDHEKEYKVWVDKKITPMFKRKMEEGVQIEKYLTKPCKVDINNGDSFNIILTEGKKHQIRRMCAALGYQVQILRRIRIIDLRVTGIKKGAGRELTKDEKQNLLKTTGLK
jgi:23S rRNA pseudouridine2604 synthase